MAGIFFRICGFFLLLICVSTVQLQAQRGDGSPTGSQNTSQSPPLQPVTHAGRRARIQPVETAPVKTALATAASTPSAANTPFIGPQLPPPPAPLTPEKQAPTPPRITFHNGLLTLESTNSRLSDVLHGVRSKANIQFEGLDSAPERVAVKLGPAPADEVLASLLQGSRFDYIILGQPENPHTVERVLLSVKSSSAGSPVGSVGSQPPGTSHPPDEVAEEATEEETVEQPPPVQQPVSQQLVPIQGTLGVPTPEELANRLREERLKQGLSGPNNTAPVKRQLPQ